MAVTIPLMAKRTKMIHKPRKIEPAVKKIFFNVPLVSTKYLDISQVASIVNRRFYRQGLNWAVAGMRLHTAPTTSGTVNVFKIQDTWPASNAWEKSFALWNQMNDQVLDDQPSIKPRFHDFKIHMDGTHVGNQFSQNLIPYVENAAGTQTQYLEGEWTRSLLEIPNDGAPGVTNAYALMMHGADSGSAKAMVQGYADSRSVPTEPDPVTQAGADTGWMNLLLDVGDSHEEIALNLQTIGEDLPYNQLAYPGAGDGNAIEPALHAIANITNTTVGGTTSIEGGNFQCGLIKIVSILEDTTPADPGPLVTAFELELILVPGTHRGYLAESMQDV